MGWNPTPVTDWEAGAASVVFGKLAAWTFMPFSASEKIVAAVKLAVVKLTVKPSTSIEENDALVFTVRASLNA